MIYCLGLIDNFAVPNTKLKVPELGHAGVMFINGKTGLTKYFEYGRYDREGLGLVRRIRISDISITGGQVDLKSLKIPLRQLSDRAGQGGRILAAYTEVEEKFQRMLEYAQMRQKQNSSRKRKP